MGVIEELEDNDAGCCPTVKKVTQKEMSWDHPKFTNLKVKFRLKIGAIQIFRFIFTHKTPWLELEFTLFNILDLSVGRAWKICYR